MVFKSILTKINKQTNNPSKHAGTLSSTVILFYCKSRINRIIIKSYFILTGNKGFLLYNSLNGKSVLKAVTRLKGPSNAAARLQANTGSTSSKRRARAMVEVNSQLLHSYPVSRPNSAEGAARW